MAAANAQIRRVPVVLPGFHDAHAHPFGAGLRLMDTSLSLAGMDLDGIAAAVRNKHIALPPSEELFGSGFDGVLNPPRGPAAFLELHAPGRVVVLSGRGGHVVWASPKALARIPLRPGNPVTLPDGVDAVVVSVDGDEATVRLLDGAKQTTDTVELMYGRKDDVEFQRDEHGVPTGYLRNPWAEQLRVAVRRELSSADLESALQRGLREMASWGITAVLDAWVSADRFGTYKEAYRTEIANGGLMLPRACLAFGVRPHQGDDPQNTIAEVTAMRASLRINDTSEVPSLSANSIKLEVDGLPAEGFAWMLRKYPGARQPPCGGPIGWTRDSLRSVVNAAVQADFNVHAHVMGDGAVRALLDYLEDAEAPFDQTEAERLHCLAHLFHIATEDVPRFRAARATALFTPHWLHPEWVGMVTSEQIAGEKEARRITPVKELLEAGQRVCFGSDWDVIRDPWKGVSPLSGIEVALTHRRPGAGAPGLAAPDWVWQSDGRLDLATALHLQTFESAKCMMLGKHTGTLEKGKRADLVCLEKDPFEVEPWELSTIKVLETMVDGKSAFLRRCHASYGEESSA
eukprot:TRINITY_DN29864_c0_g1_i1.p1 TRINITY_DN29864_c0_g1~~TRINITY_DN29864_c0_g1_i1.p1  ORF type:complete len:624 (+),score=93.26 TRINITY_DN29864_c0_g1_i1:155-1873(+)